MALVDARYRFIMVDVGANGRACDAGIFARSTMSTALEQNEVHIPPPRPLVGCLRMRLAFSPRDFGF